MPFYRRKNEDKTYDSICLSCFQCTPKRHDPLDLIEDEVDHKCDANYVAYLERLAQVRI